MKSTSKNTGYSKLKSDNIIELYMSRNKIELPLIKISNTPLKLIIDIGWTIFFINPDLAFKYYKIFHEQFAVSTVFQITSHDYCSEIPTSKEFNNGDSPKFHLFQFHNIFDGLIELYTLKLLTAQLDFIVSSQLLSPNSTLPIY